MHYVYVLYFEKDKGLYIGYSSDLARRLKEHRSGESFSTHYRLPFILAYYEAYACHEDAIGRELFLKSGSGRHYLRKQLSLFFTSHPLRTRDSMRESGSLCQPRGA